MTIDELIELKYKELSADCVLNVIERKEYKKQITDIEDKDRLHSLLIRLLSKYKDVDLGDVDEAYMKIKREISGEMGYYLKLKKTNCIIFADWRIE